MTTQDVVVRCDGDVTRGWTCEVLVTPQAAPSRHEVTVRPATLARLHPGSKAPDALVAASFAFLLEREPPSAILASFDLEVIGRYFPGWEWHVAGAGGDA